MFVCVMTKQIMLYIFRNKTELMLIFILQDGFLLLELKKELVVKEHQILL